jgi:multidrug resistance efflux pump
MKWLLIVGLTVALGSLVSWQLFPADSRSSAAASANATPAGACVLEVQGIGYVEPVSEVRRLLLRTGGVIRKCYWAAATVRKGEVILELEDATQQAEVELARRNLEMVQADAANANAGINPYKLEVCRQAVERLREKLRHCKLEADRYRLMLGSRSTSQQDYEAAETQRRQSEVALKEQEAELEHLKHSVTPEHRAWQEARIEHARAQRDLAEERLRETRLLAPFDGTVMRLLKREGEGVRTFEPEPVVLFGDLSKLRVRAEIDERFVTRLEVGQEAVVQGRNTRGKSYPGKVVQVEKILGDKTVFTRSSSERKDLNVLQVVIEMGAEFRAPVGLQVDVRIRCAVATDEGELR